MAFLRALALGRGLRVLWQPEAQAGAALRLEFAGRALARLVARSPGATLAIALPSGAPGEGRRILRALGRELAGVTLVSPDLSPGQPAGEPGRAKGAEGAAAFRRMAQGGWDVVLLGAPTADARLWLAEARRRLAAAEAREESQIPP